MPSSLVLMAPSEVQRDVLAYVSLDDLFALALSANSHAELVREHILLPGRWLWPIEYHKQLSSMHFRHVRDQNGLLLRTIRHPTARRKLVETVEDIDDRFMTLPVKAVNCVRDGGQLFVPGQNPRRYVSKAGAGGLKCCSATSDEIPLGHDSNIADLVGRVLPQVIFNLI